MTRIPNNLCERAIGMLDAGMLTEYVARHVGCSSSLSDMKSSHKISNDTGSTNDLPRRGHLHVTKLSQDHNIMNMHLCNLFQTATATAANTPGFYNNRISAETVRNRLR